MRLKNEKNWIVRFHTLGSDLESRKKKVITVFSMWGMVFLSAYILYDLIVEEYFHAFINTLAFFNISAVYVFNSFDKKNITRFIIFSLIPIIVIAFNVVLGKAGSEYYLFSLIVLAFYILERKRDIVILTLYCAVCFIVIRYIDPQLVISESSEMMSAIAFYPNILSSFILLFLITNVFLNENRDHQQNLEKQNTELENQNNIIQTLLKELNHRVKNNLQLVSSLLNLQLSSLKDPKAKKALEESKNRIISMALLHRMLYKDGNEMKVNMPEYIKELTDYLKDSIFTFGQKDKIIIDVDNFSLLLETSVSIGLILNELITNSVKHGFSNSETKTITIKAKLSADNKLFLKVEDNGKKFPSNFSFEKHSNFGLELVGSLVDQYNGTLEIKNNKEKSVNISLNI